MENIVHYLIDFLARFPISQLNIVHYGKLEDISANTKIVIIPAFSNFEITILPKLPFEQLEDTPILFGNSKIVKQNGLIIVYADIIASSFFLISRYEEILKPECRDQHGRFLAKDSIVFQQGYGNRPLVDEYSMMLRNWLNETGINVPTERKGFNKIYLTHDVDRPFFFKYFNVAFKQFIKNLLRYNYYASPLKKYFYVQYDDYYTFPKIINYDKILQASLHNVAVECIYFIITSGTTLPNVKSYNIFSHRIDRLIKNLRKSGAKIGLHLSYDAGVNPGKIKHESEQFRRKMKVPPYLNRHHFLQWREPDDIVYMEQAGITDDFTLSYADCAGFRTGTCRPYRFINPKTKELTNVTIHPLEIMECTLDGPQYMNLNYDGAFTVCKEIINQVYKHNGELVLLWHNTKFLGQGYCEILYKSVLDYIKSLY